VFAALGDAATARNSRLNRVFLHKTSIAHTWRFREFPLTTRGLWINRSDAIESAGRKIWRCPRSSNETKQFITIAIVDSNIGVNNGVARFDD
jgi:hypothetical protein